MKLSGIIQGITQGINGPEVIILCDIPGREGKYIVGLVKPGAAGQPATPLRFTFDMRSDGIAILDSRSDIEPGTGGMVKM